MAAPASQRTPEFSHAYRTYALVLLVVVYIFNFIDRTIVNILLEAIGKEFDLADWQLGFFSGTAFAIFYATLGVPIARFADRSQRRRIIAVALAFWSLMTAGQGLAVGFASLALARVLVGVGEAGCSPPAHSMIADLFAPAQRARALSIYSLGIPIGGAIGYFVGGWVRQLFGWREAFMLVGLPGVLLAALVLFTLREPTRGHWEGPRAGTGDGSLREAFAFISRLPSFWHLAFGGALHAFYGYGAATFNPAFFERIHGFSPGEYGTIVAAIGLTAGVLGTYLGGYLGDRFGARDVRSYAWVPGVGSVVAIPFVIGVYLAPDRWWAIAIWLMPAALAGLYLGPTFAMTQALVPPRMRSQAAAILLLVLNLIGYGLGPQFVGALSDWLKPAHGIDSIRYALMWTIVVGAAWSVIHYWLAARTLGRDLEAQHALA